MVEAGDEKGVEGRKFEVRKNGCEKWKVRGRNQGSWRRVRMNNQDKLTLCQLK
jgi:hypothetical protein